MLLGAAELEKQRSVEKREAEGRRELLLPRASTPRRRSRSCDGEQHADVGGFALKRLAAAAVAKQR